MGDKQITFEIKDEIITFLLEMYPNKIIDISGKKLGQFLDKNGLISDVDEMMFFYAKPDKDIERKLNEYGFNFVLKTDNENRLTSKSSKKETNTTDYTVEINKSKRQDQRKLMNKPSILDFYIATNDIPAMKLLMLDKGINFDNNPYYQKLFKKSNEEIENNFERRLKFTHKKFDIPFSELITNHQFDNPQFRFIEIGAQWQSMPQWISFFWELGKFIDTFEEPVSFFISYIERTIPAIISTAGVLDSFYLKTFKNRGKRQFQIGSNVLYKLEDKWMGSTVLRYETIAGMKKEFNPYIVIEVNRPNESKIIEKIPNNLIEKKIRYTDNKKIDKRYRSKDGNEIINKEKGIKYIDKVSGVMELRYGKENIDRIKNSANKRVNLIGRGIDKGISEIYKEVQFADEIGSFTLADLVYLDTSKETDFSNVHVVNSKNIDITAEEVCIFTTEKMGLDYQNHATEKNIYFTSRTNTTYLDNTEGLLNTLRQKTTRTYSDRNKILDLFRQRLSTKQTEIPKGVEIYVF